MHEEQTYTLMHKDVEVADIGIDPEGYIVRVIEMRNLDHMPYGTIPLDEGFCSGLADWWEGRAIPRSHLDFWLVQSTSINEAVIGLLPMSLGLSLSDQYWIRPDGDSVQWRDANFFENPFPGDVGDLLFGVDLELDGIDPRSPDLTTEGNLRKRWVIADGGRCLLKAGGRMAKQEPYNEVIASRIMDVLGIEHVGYGLVHHKGECLSTCRCFVDTDTEFISARRAMRSSVRGDGESVYDLYVRLCAEHDLDICPFLDRMIVQDYLIANTDRHWNNFGIVRDADTLEWLKPAPLFDNGASLW